MRIRVVVNVDVSAAAILAVGLLNDDTLLSSRCFLRR
jgi:hypothetical protein